jgi:hypothetical protein
MFPVELSRNPTPPIELSEVKAALRVDFAADDGSITAIVLAETRRYEEFTRRCIMQTQWKLVSASWRAFWQLRLDPVRSVDVKYLDVNGVEQTLPETEWALVQYDPCMGGPIVTIRYGVTLPELADEADAVRILIDAGAALPDDDPVVYPLDDADRGAILHMVKRVYDHDDPLTEEDLRRRFSGRRLLW